MNPKRENNNAHRRKLERSKTDQESSVKHDIWGIKLFSQNYDIMPLIW